MPISIIRVFYGVLLGIVLLFAGRSALAQNGGGPVDNPCAVPAPNVPAYYTDLGVGKPFACMPAPGGPGVGLTVRYNASGVTSWWYCPGANGTHITSFGAATWARLSSGNLTPDTPLADPSLSPVWCPWAAEMRAGLPKPPAPAPAWAVASTTAYKVVKGALSSVAGPVARGTPCDCSKPLFVGALRYCTFTGAASSDIVSLCKAP